MSARSLSFRRLLAAPEREPSLRDAVVVVEGGRVRLVESCVAGHRCVYRLGRVAQSRFRHQSPPAWNSSRRSPIPGPLLSAAWRVPRDLGPRRSIVPPDSRE